MKSNKTVVAVSIGTALATAGTAAMAELPTEVTGLFTSLSTDVGLVFAAAVGVWVAIRGPAAIIRVANRFISKAGA